MPRHYTRRNNNRYKRPGYKACAKMFYGDASRVYGAVRPFFNTERKFHDVVEVTALLNTTPNIEDLSLIVQGTGAAQRIGNSIRISSAQMRMIYSDNDATNTLPIHIRHIVFKWTDDAAPLSAQILVSNTILSPLNVNNSHKYRIIYDAVIGLSPNGRETVVRKYYKNQSQIMKFDGGGSTDHVSGSYWSLAFSDNTADPPTLKFVSRLRYVDN